ncbi:hypothetical protein TNCV_2118861 [Trichonephila clavipes]|nr:hypothetical protein TNCV_2118861 [Trichonephila clavipes]
MGNPSVVFCWTNRNSEMKNRRISGEKYGEISDDQAHPMIEILFPAGDEIFPFDNGPIPAAGLDLWHRTATAGSDVVQSRRPIFDDFFQHLWPYIGHNTANVVFQMVKRLWLIRIDQ